MTDTLEKAAELLEQARVLLTRDEQPTVGTADWDRAAGEWLAEYEPLADQLGTDDVPAQDTGGA